MRLMIFVIISDILLSYYCDAYAIIMYLIKILCAECPQIAFSADIALKFPIDSTVEWLPEQVTF